MQWMRKKKKKRGKWSGLQLPLQQQVAVTQEKNLQIIVAIVAEEEEEDPSSTYGGCRRRRRGESAVVSNSRCNSKLL